MLVPASYAEVLARPNAGGDKLRLVEATGCTFVKSAPTFHDIESQGILDTLAGHKDAIADEAASDAFKEGRALAAQ